MPASSRRSPRGLARAAREHFLTGIWSPRLEGVRGWKAGCIRVQRVFSAAVAEFLGDQCLLRASALTFYTLLSVVPVLAVIFGIAKGFGLEKLLEKELMEQMAGQQETVERILTFARNMLENTRGGLIAGVGVVVMFWSAFKVLGQIESALNAMWEVRRSRTWIRRFSDYLTVMLVAPILLLVAGSASVFLGTQFKAVVARFEIVGMIGPVVLQALRLTPLVMVWALFLLIYLAMPNTRVRPGAAAAGAGVGAVLYLLVQWIYIDLQVGVAQQNAIYGSFAALPLFLAWVQASWIIVLFGAEVCYAVQHGDSYCRATGCPVPAASERKLIALHITRLAVQRFSAGDPPLTARGMASACALPLSLVRPVLADLVAAHILSETVGPKPDEPGFQPAVDPSHLTLQRVSDALESVVDGTPGSLQLPFADDGRLDEALRNLSRASAETPANRLLKDL
jgi:membrane protein